MSTWTQLRLPWRSSCRLLNDAGTLTSRRFYTPRVIAENDIVFLKSQHNPNGLPILTHPLRFGKEQQMPNRDFIKHADIIGKRLRDSVESKRRATYRILEPTLAEYIDNSPRLVTPIYSQDANLIVSLLDLHPTVPGEKGASDERLEIFEAGTGHGALTLNLARAIHGANTPAPEQPNSEDYDKDLHTSLANATYDRWRETRRAVIHTLDCSAKHSEHAQNVVSNYRHGIYSNDIDFHVGSIEEYISGRLEKTCGKPFLDHAILDLPSTHEYMEIVGKALKPNGTLITFCPSITQINACVLLTREKKLPLFIDNTLECLGVGGREWDVRPVKVRAKAKEEAAKALEDVMAEESDQTEASDISASAAQSNATELVCRPRAGARVVGGGFIGFWRKMVTIL